MTTIVVDKELREKLQDMEHEVVFCDEAGKTIGHYLPETTYLEHMKVLYDRARQLFAEEDVEAARRDPEEFTTAEVLDYLSKL